MANRFLFIGKVETTTGSTTGSTEYNLRDFGPGGGYIFYINPNSSTDGWTYLESFPNAGIEDSTGPWTSSDLSTVLNGNTLSTVGSGYDNTMAILNQSGYTGSSCPKYCVELDNGYSDWFMPSFDEVVLLRNNLYLYGLGNFSPTASYWTSTESSATFGFRYKIGTGVYDGTHVKSSFYNYRAIRRF